MLSFIRPLPAALPRLPCNYGVSICRYDLSVWKISSMEMTNNFDIIFHVLISNITDDACLFASLLPLLIFGVSDLTPKYSLWFDVYCLSFSHFNEREPIWKASSSLMVHWVTGTPTYSHYLNKWTFTAVWLKMRQRPALWNRFEETWLKL